MRVDIRVVVIGAVMGFMTALVPGCVRPCAETCKTGCCDSNGTCRPGTEVAACGLGGAMCASCASDELCTNNTCMQSRPDPMDGGMTMPVVCTKDSDCANDMRGPICDVPTGECTQKCANDLACSRFMNGSICDLMSGKCAPARVGTRLGQGCNDDTECQESNDFDDPCFRGGQGCICSKTDAPVATGAMGTCRRRLQPCEVCTNDEQCGSNAILFSPPDGIGVGACRAFMGDTSGKKYCRYQKVGQCPCGNIDDGTGYCAPQSNSCSQIGCQTDKNCPGGSVCSVNNPDAGAGSCGGTCVPRCRWDFLNQELVTPGCPQGQTCWVDSKNLDPNSIFYGSGRCKPACNSNDDCKLSVMNPFGGDNLACLSEKGPNSTMTAKRCRANGQCMDNAECPEERDPNVPNLGYCDRGAFTCNKDCRIGDDPVTGQPYRDCRRPYACGPDGGMNVCRIQSCVEQGGAGNACSTGEFCCGEDKNGDGQPDPCPPRSEQNEVGCYRAPEPPFCQMCRNDQECNMKPLPAWLTSQCTNGSKSPSCSPLPMKCIIAAVNPMAQTVLRACAPSTVNDRSAVAPGSSRTKADRGCPVNYDEQAIAYDRVPMSADDCASDQDCRVNSPNGRCGTHPTRRLQDGGITRTCLCTAGTLKTECPNDADAGIVSECLDGVSGSTSICIESFVCVFSGNRYTAPRDGGFGCGLPPP
jgi:hypothetical protein